MCMQLYKKPVATNKTHQLQRCIQGLQLISIKLQTILQSNPVASNKEQEEIKKNLQDTIALLTDVANRTKQASSLIQETNTELMMSSDAELGGSWKGRYEDVLYISSIATTMTDRLYKLDYMDTHSNNSLTAYWASLPREHARLMERWKRAIG